MKFLGNFFSFIIIGCLNLIVVLAEEIPESRYIRDSDFEYYIQYDGYNMAVVTNVLNKMDETLSFNPYVFHDGEQYDVIGIVSGLKDCAVTKLIIPHYIYNTFSVDNNVLREAKYLKELQINSLSDVLFFENTFNGVNPNLQIHGQGVDKALSAYARRLVEIYLSDTIMDYKKENFLNKAAGLYKIARYVQKNFQYTSKTESASNGASVLFLKQGDSIGRARVIRLLALAAGYPEEELLVGGDGGSQGFNYVLLPHQEWYIVDNYFYQYNDEYIDYDFYLNVNTYLSISNNRRGDSDNFVLYNFKYGCPHEGPLDNSIPEKENFKKWLTKNKKGTLIIP
eukprot:jgi/Orpsp1_1/1182008/evm.model.c7180000079509.1